MKTCPQCGNKHETDDCHCKDCAEKTDTSAPSQVAFETKDVSPNFHGFISIFSIILLILSLYGSLLIFGDDSVYGSICFFSSIICFCFLKGFAEIIKNTQNAYTKQCEINETLLEIKNLLSKNNDI